MHIFLLEVITIEFLVFTSIAISVNEMMVIDNMHSMNFNPLICGPRVENNSHSPLCWDNRYALHI
jgi:hypothetical protein